jgi:hypothetical protein
MEIGYAKLKRVFGEFRCKIPWQQFLEHIR